MGVIEYPFNINYQMVSSIICSKGESFVRDKLETDGWSESVINVIIKQALKRGWGS